MDLYIQVEVAGQKRAAQREMEGIVKRTLPSQGIRNIGLPSGNRDETSYAQADGRLGCAFGSAEDARVPRRWNAPGARQGRRHHRAGALRLPAMVGSGRVHPWCSHQEPGETDRGVQLPELRALLLRNADGSVTVLGIVVFTVVVLTAALQVSPNPMQLGLGSPGPKLLLLSSWRYPRSLL
ncbi:hypothetical protein X767_32390 [Mesorhizobium sp. LSJC264A00]|nr:hypothetical protein X767_32390 [Mesorhizobium sp. LSJC264A00]